MSWPYSLVQLSSAVDVQTKQYDEGLQPLVEMWKKEKEKASKIYAVRLTYLAWPNAGRSHADRGQPHRTTRNRALSTRHPSTPTFRTFNSSRIASPTLSSSPTASVVSARTPPRCVDAARTGLTLDRGGPPTGKLRLAHLGRQGRRTHTWPTPLLAPASP